jgi:hypothetical protein
MVRRMHAYQQTAEQGRHDYGYAFHPSGCEGTHHHSSQNPGPEHVHMSDPRALRRCRAKRGSAACRACRSLSAGVEGGSIPVWGLTWAPSIWRRSPARWQTRPTTNTGGWSTHRPGRSRSGRPAPALTGRRRSTSTSWTWSHRSTAALRCSPLVCRDVHYDRLLCDSGDHQSPPLRRRNNDLREVGGLITAQTVTLEFSGGLSSRGRPRREEQP